MSLSILTTVVFNKALHIAFQGIIERDEMVFKKARELKIPIVMLTSGGYLKKTAQIIADSILNLYEHSLISNPDIVS